MAPKIKITADNILDAAVQAVRANGIEALNARRLAEKLNCSVQPIFRNFETMDAVKDGVYCRAEELYNAEMLRALDSDGFLAMGLAYIHFARREPHLFQLLFMSDVFSQGSAADIAGTTTGDEAVLAHIEAATGLPAPKAQALYTGVWLVTHGMASLLAMNSCALSDGDITRLLRLTFEGLCYALQKEDGEAL